VKRPSWLREPEEFRRWRLGLEPLDERYEGLWSTRVGLLLWLALALLDEGPRSWFTASVIALLVIDGLRALRWWRGRRRAEGGATPAAD
jgi:hypothetical protein